MAQSSLNIFPIFYRIEKLVTFLDSSSKIKEKEIQKYFQKKEIHKRNLIQHALLEPKPKNIKFVA